MAHDGVMNTTPGMARLTINLEPVYLEALKRLAAREHISVSAYLRRRIAALADADPTVFAPSVPDEIRRRARRYQEAEHAR